MKIYLIRHGYTDSLVNRTFQPQDEALNEVGHNQSKALAKRFEGVEMDFYVSSSFKRALQTAGKFPNKFLISPLFGEIRRPSEVIGKPRYDEEGENFIKKLEEKNISDPSWHYSDEENFVDLRNRGAEALEYLKSLNGENILVITHGHFSSILFGIMLYGNDLPVEIYYKLIKFLRLNNTGVSICEYTDGSWKLKCWNDTTHCP